MKNKYLVLVQNKQVVSKLSQESQVTFLFPIKGFTVGFPLSFSLDDIPQVPAYLFVNRILDHQGIVLFQKFLNNVPRHIEGIVFDDVGVLQVLLARESHLKKILFLHHFNCNSVSIRAYLRNVDSVVVSTDITEEEVKYILEHVDKPLVLYTFGHVPIMYSRRKLLTNYNAHFDKHVPLVSKLENDLKQDFHLVENEYGTVIYTGKPFNGLRYLAMPNVLFHLVNTLFLSDKEVVSLVKGKIDEQLYSYRYLSEKETTFRVKEREI